MPGKYFIDKQASQGILRNLAGILPGPSLFW
jgi:hypothetical protein